MPEESDVVRLLNKRNLDTEFPQYANMRAEVNLSYEDYKSAERAYKKSLEHLQSNCTHPIILEYKGGYGYDAGGMRVCFICGLSENQPIADPGDEYDFATYGSYRVLTGSQYRYSASEGREVYQVPRQTVFQVRTNIA